MTVRAGRTKTSTENQKLDGGQAKLEVAEFKETQGQDVWDAPFGPHASSSSTAIQNQPPQLAIMDEDPVVKWVAIEKNLLEAREAQQRLLRDSGKIVGKCKTSKDEDLQQQLRQVMNQLQLSLQKCSDCQTWQDRLIPVCLLSSCCLLACCHGYCPSANSFSAD